jgi:hypothetical protein
MSNTRARHSRVSAAVATAPVNPLKRGLDWFFKDNSVRRGRYVIMETPTPSLIIFMVMIVLSVVTYPGFFQTAFTYIAYAAFVYWGIKEFRTGRSRFRKFLGIGAVIAVAGVLVLRFGF